MSRTLLASVSLHPWIYPLPITVMKTESNNILNLHSSEQSFFPLKGLLQDFNIFSFLDQLAGDLG